LLRSKLSKYIDKNRKVQRKERAKNLTLKKEKKLTEPIIRHSQTIPTKII
jgi:hypothetical protein